MPTPDFTKLDSLLSEYVSSKKLSGVVSLVTNVDEILYSKIEGVQDLASRVPMTWESIFRIYSMTKPVTSVAAMMMWEAGKFDLDDPVSDYLPAFKDSHVLEEDGTVRPAARQVTIRDLLCHTAGITLPAFAENHLVPMYLNNNLDGMRSRGSLIEVVDRLGQLPLLFDPGSQWSYSMATDVVGRLVEVWSGLALSDFFQRRIFKPLNMNDTAFTLAEKDKHRMTTNYSVEDDKLGSVIDAGETSSYLTPPEFASGSGGLLSTARDYLQFTRMLLNGGTLNDTRILQPATVELMARNHLDGDMADMGAEGFNGASWQGIGFGLGFSVVVDPEKAGYGPDVSDWGWTGAAGTVFFINPALNMAAILLTQYMPSRAYPLRLQFRKAVYDAF
jgi:CubicO group peptidase (beta-lactamase class C family)|tara:strand:- start:279 stop:1445 length:1167 start_codon:yes stop_codon:yes gene_type:complete